MARLIDADLLLENYNLKDADKRNPEGIDTLMKYEVKDMIEDAPTVDAVPVVHGEWLYIEGSWECSVCRKENACAYDEVLHRFIDFFCPKCGAKMDGKEKE